jgi:hypothetical protein
MPELGSIITQSEVGPLITLTCRAPEAGTFEITLAPQYGSNLTRFRYDTYELITCDYQALQRHDFIGIFVLANPKK